MSTRTFTREFLEEDLEIPWGGPAVKHAEFIDSGRWSEHWKAVFEHEGKFYEVKYELPSTEYQEGLMPFEQYGEEIPAKEVELREVTVEKWLPVD
jgi:hypothetical protein